MPANFTARPCFIAHLVLKNKSLMKIRDLRFLFA